VVAQGERADQPGALAIDPHQEADDRPEDVRDAGAHPARRVERRVGGGHRLFQVALVEGVQHAVLVAEAGVERPHRGSRAPRDLGYRGVLEALLGHQQLGGVQQTHQGLLTARLLGRADPLELSVVGMHARTRNRISILVLT
jgi:hypothetical protein